MFLLRGKACMFLILNTKYFWARFESVHERDREVDNKDKIK
jgi:hypothetical protein